MDTGMGWKVIKHEVMDTFPSLCTLIQDAGNLVQGACQQVTVLQCLMKLKHALASKTNDMVTKEFVKGVLIHNDSVKEWDVIVMEWEAFRRVWSR